MQHRKVSDLMTRHVVSARDDTPFKEVARLLTENEIAALPVVDDGGRPIGVVSESDLLRKASDQPGVDGRVPLPPLEGWERAKARGARADELMSAPAVCARPDWNVVEAAQLMEVQGIKRLPVVDDTDRLLGIISRRDLLQIFLRKDDAIREEIEHDVLQQTVGLAPSQVSVAVRDGRVELRGVIGTKSLIPIVVRLCSAVDGVVGVSDHLSFQVDDAGRTPLGA
ncbi:CBS domain-containing protein [Streptomyces sp. MAR4 CNY-716]